MTITISLATIAATSSATTNPLWWYITRAAAVSAYITLGATVALGLFRALGRVRQARVNWMLNEAHTFLPILTVALIGLHLLALALDLLIPFSVLDLLLPLAQPYRPVPTDLGVLALYTLVVVALSSWLRRWFSYARWRALHYVSFATFLLVTLHGIFAGSDSGTAWMRLVYVASAGLVLLLVAARLYHSRRVAVGAAVSVADRRAV